MGDQINITTQGDVNFAKNQSTATIVNEKIEFETAVKQKLKGKDSTKNQWLIATVIIPVIATIVIPLLIYFLSRPTEEPKFIIENSILRSDATLVIRADNKKANKKENLNIMFDGCSFPNKGISIPIQTFPHKIQKWHFTLKNYTTINTLTKDGEHKIKVSFPGGKYSDEYKIIFISKPPIVKILKSHDHGQTKIKGKVTTELQLPKNILTVNITYFHEGKECKITEIPLTKKIHPETGIVYYEFESILQGLPNLKPDDPRYSELFWQLEVTDQAENQYYHKQSYAKFMAPGNDQIGVGNIASIKIEKITDDVSNQLRNIVRIVPNQTLINKLPNGKQPIELSVKAVDKSAKLNWKYNIDNIEPITLIFKNDKKIGASASTEYIDYNSGNKYAKYRVEQRSDNIIYSSAEKMIESEDDIKNHDSTEDQRKMMQVLEDQKKINQALEKSNIQKQAIQQYIKEQNNDKIKENQVLEKGNIQKQAIQQYIKEQNNDKGVFQQFIIKQNEDN